MASTSGAHRRECEFSQLVGMAYAPAAHYGIMDHVVAQPGVALLEVMKDIDGAAARLHDVEGRPKDQEVRKP